MHFMQVASEAGLLSDPTALCGLATQIHPGREIRSQDPEFQRGQTGVSSSHVSPEPELDHAQTDNR
jgi:hypothetical protein